MSGQSLQTCSPVKDTMGIINHVLFDEEPKTAGVGLGSRKVGYLAEILGGEARTPHWIGKGWRGEPGDGLDPLDPAAVAIEFARGARKQTRVYAWSCVMHVPKGLSLVVASDPELREWFSTVRPLMAAAYMDALESGAEVRVGSGNVRELVPVKGLKGYWVGHSISAGGDPHLHNHLIFSSTAETIDGRIGQIDGKKLLRQTAMLADAAARRVLMNEAAKMALRFGLDGELLGVDPEVVERASTGRNAVAAIQSYFAAEGTPISDTQAWHHWRQIAEGKEDRGLSRSLVASIRAARGQEMGAEAIEHALDAAMADAERARVVGAWLANKYGISRSEREGLSGRARAASKVEPHYGDATMVIALMATLSYAPKPEVVEALCARFADNAARPALLAEVAADPRVLVGDKHWVLRSQLEREQLVAARATKLLAGVKSDATIDELLGDTEGTALVVISGVAGGGKSSALADAKPKWSAKGVTV